MNNEAVIAWVFCALAFAAWKLFDKRPGGATKQPDKFKPSRKAIEELDKEPAKQSVRV